jgi:alpha-L-fucosidase
MKRFSLLTFFVCFLLASAGLQAQTYTPTPENLRVREQFRTDRFGMFIHWGLYSQLGSGEWVQHDWKIPHKTYEKLAGQFNPTQFSADAIVLAAKSAGMKYITITTKHHDGFCLWDSKLTAFDVIDATPFKRDIIKEMAEACKRHGITLCLYYSLLDWHHPDYLTTGNHGKLGFMGGRANADFSKYVDYMCGQLTEILTNYGPIGAIWFDGEWENKSANWEFDKIYRAIHKAQPACLIGNNHHANVRPGEDFQMFEKDLPGQNSHGWASHAADVAKDLPLEMCETMNGSWGFKLNDNKFKSSASLTKLLTQCAAADANLLLNVGPMSNGLLQPEFIDTLSKIGSWMKLNGPTIYGTRGGITRSWGVTTQKENQILMHIFKPEDGRVYLPLTGKKVVSIVRNAKSNAAITFRQDANGVTVNIPSDIASQEVLTLTWK